MLEQHHRLIYHTAEQGSEEWHAARLGKVTGTKAQPLLTATNKNSRGGLAAGCWSLIYELASDIAFPDPPNPDPYKSGSMDRGNRLEPHARTEYELAKFTPVTEVGFVEVEGRLAGFSADGVIPPTTGTEIKCLTKAHHMRWLEEGVVPKAHHAQIQWTIFCAGFDGWDLVHYHPRFAPKRGRLHIQTFKADAKAQDRFAEAFPLLEAEIHRLVEKYRAEATIPALPAFTE